MYVKHLLVIYSEGFIVIKFLKKLSVVFKHTFLVEKCFEHANTALQ